MNNPIIHIGYPKTATIWFIKFFYPNIKNATIIYADDFIYDTSHENDHFSIKSEKLQHTGQNLIIVSHKFSGLENFNWDHGRYRTFFIKHLKHNFPDASIVVFLRNQVDFLASAYSSYLTHGGTYTFPELFKTGRLNDGQMFSFEYLDYYKVISQYKEQFGEDHVHVFLYEQFQENPMAFLKSYADLFELDINIGTLNVSKYNEKLREGLARFVRFSNLFHKKGIKFKKTIIDAPWLFSWVNKKTIAKMNNSGIFGKKTDNKKILGDELINYINQYYKVSNNLLITQFNLKEIKNYNYPI